jgi:hypothetical protein
LVIPLVRGWAIGPSCGCRGCCWSPPSPCPPCSRSPSPQPTLVGYLTAGATPVWLLGSFAVLSLLYRAEVSTDQSAAAAEASVEPAPTSAAVAPSSAAAPQSGAEVLTKGAQAERVYAGPQRRWRAGQRWAAGRGGWAHPELRPCPGRPVPGPTTGRPPAQRSAGRPGRRGPRGRTMTSAALADRAGASRLVAALEHPWAIISVPASRRPPGRGGSLGLSMQASEGWANLPATTRPPQRVQPEAAGGRVATGRARQSGPSQPAGWARQGRRTVMAVDLVSVSWPPGRWQPPGPSPRPALPCDGLLARSASRWLLPGLPSRFASPAP